MSVKMDIPVESLVHYSTDDLLAAYQAYQSECTRLANDDTNIATNRYYQHVHDLKYETAKILTRRGFIV